ncbi:MAG: M20/M25/M40 family metallo-hydrolase [Parashewanella sp.]
MQKRTLLAIVTGLAISQANATETSHWLTFNNNTAAQFLLSQSQISPIESNKMSRTNKGVSIAEVNQQQLQSFSESMLKQRQRCGGFMVHDSLESALAAASVTTSMHSFKAPVINQRDRIEQLIPQLDANNIVDMINQQAANTNRIYKLSTGSTASNQLAKTWGELVSGLSYASVRQIEHSGFPQKSVELTLTGSKYPDDIVVLGGHLDSTAGMFFQSKKTRAPGADDDASGIASLTEIIRVLAQNKVQPQRTLRFYGYAAEEGGLLGSQQVVKAVKANNENVLSAMQLDMTGYQGSEQNVTFERDYTDDNLTDFLEKLMDTYLTNLTYAEDKCGYGCSDHASWHKFGYPSAMPFEAFMKDMNHNIHSKHDTLDNSDPTGMNQLNFSKLGLVYALEMGFPS